MLSIDAVGSYQLELCVVEAMTNVVKHAYHGEAGHSAELVIRVCKDRLIFTLTDNGETLNPVKGHPPAVRPPGRGDPARARHGGFHPEIHHG